MQCYRSVLSVNVLTVKSLIVAAAIATAVGSVFAAANAAQAQTVVHVRTADLKASDTANMKIEPVHWRSGVYYHSYYRAPYRAYYGGPYRSYYGGAYRYYGGGAYRAWYGNPYYAYWRYPSYYYAPAIMARRITATPATRRTTRRPWFRMSTHIRAAWS